MKKCVRLLCAVMLMGVLGTAGVARAEVSPLAWASADSEILASINLRQLADSTLVKHLLEGPGGAQAAAGIQIFRNMTGIDLLKDLDRVVLWGRIRDDDSVVIVVQGRFDPAALITLLKVNPQYAESTFGETTIHQWFDEREKKLKYGAFPPDGSAVVASRKSELEAALSSYGTDKGFLTAANSRYLPSGYADAAAWFLVIRPDRLMPDGKPIDSLQAQAAAGAITLQEGAVQARLTLDARSAQASAKWQTLLHGALALLQLQEGNADIRDLASNAKTRLDSEANRIILELGIPEDQVLRILQSGKTN